ncbi:hypothetical protein ACFE04_008509 [Oxalis oulophora]
MLFEMLILAFLRNSILRPFVRGVVLNVIIVDTSPSLYVKNALNECSKLFGYSLDLLNFAIETLSDNKDNAFECVSGAMGNTDNCADKFIDRIACCHTARMHLCE